MIQFLSLTAEGDEFSSLNAIYFKNPQNSDFFSWRNSFENVFLVYKESGILSIKFRFLTTYDLNTTQVQWRCPCNTLLDSVGHSLFLFGPFLCSFISE